MIISNTEVLIILSENREWKPKYLHLYDVLYMLLGVKHQVQDNVINLYCLNISVSQVSKTGSHLEGSNLIIFIYMYIYSGDLFELCNFDINKCTSITRFSTSVWPQSAQQETKQEIFLSPLSLPLVSNFQAGYSAPWIRQFLYCIILQSDFRWIIKSYQDGAIVNFQRQVDFISITEKFYGLL